MYPIYPYYGKEIKCKEQLIAFPPQKQEAHPGLEYVMQPQPISENPYYNGSGKLHGKVALITGGDSGIGKATAIAFAKEGADIAIVYYNEHIDAENTKQRIEEIGQSCLLISGDLKEEKFSTEVVEKTIKRFNRINILVNNHAEQYTQQSILDITSEQLEETFKTNIFSYFYLTKAVLPHMKFGDCIINTSSVTAQLGHGVLIDYASTKGAVDSFTKSLAISLVEQGIRVNAVAPGPIWTPLITTSFSREAIGTFGTTTKMKRAGQPFELAPIYVYLASDDSSYVTGEIMNVNGGHMLGASGEI